MKQRLKKYLRRKFEIIMVNQKQTCVVIDIKLTNFWGFDEKKLVLRVGASKLPYKINKISNGRYRITLEKSMFDESSYVVDFYYNNKKLWAIGDNQCYEVLNINEGYYTVSVNMSLTLSKFKTNYIISQDEVYLSVKQSDGSCIKLQSDHNLESLVLLSGNKSFEIITNENRLDLSSIQDVVQSEKYRVLAVISGVIHPVRFNSYAFSYFSCLKYDWQNDGVIISINQLNIDDFFITHTFNSENLMIRALFEKSFEQEFIFEKKDDYFAFDTLALLDENLKDIVNIPTTITSTGLLAQVPTSLFSSAQNKRIVAVFKGKDLGEKRLLVLNPQNVMKFRNYYISNNEVYQLDLLNKQGLLFISKKPRNRAGIHKVDENKIFMYYQPHSIYSTYEHFLTFEERASGNMYHVPLARGEQYISIPYNEIEKLKTQFKNVIDVFISIYDSETIVRKEKVRYHSAKYTKDGILTLKEIDKPESKVSYMATVTPFKNLKFESFEVTKTHIEILNKGELNNNVWLIGERTDTAQDNGVAFFKWLRANTNIEAYYVIDKTAKDYEKIAHLDSVIEFGTEKHFEVVSRAKVLVSTHDLENIVPFKTSKHFWHYKDTTKIFLQHGVLGRKNVEYHKHFYEVPFDLFNVSGTKEKYDVVINQLGYNDKDVAITGLSRFDNLPITDSSKVTKILLMPTWRDWLNTDEAFAKSEYLQRYLKLINDSNLLKFLEDNHIVLNFYPHYRSQEFFKKHTDGINPNVKFIELGEQTVQDLLIEHDILITDFSSVSFDFSYMKKPVIFYHFDADQFFRKGILRPISETFIGEIAYNQQEIIHKISQIIHNGYQYADEELDNIFDHVDHKNNQRVYEAIIEKLNEKQ